jgi:hypothetical protein
MSCDHKVGCTGYTLKISQASELPLAGYRGLCRDLEKELGAGYDEKYRCTEVQVFTYT